MIISIDGDWYIEATPKGYLILDKNQKRVPNGRVYDSIEDAVNGIAEIDMIYEFDCYPFTFSLSAALKLRYEHRDYYANVLREAIQKADD